MALAKRGWTMPSWRRLLLASSVLCLPTLAVAQQPNVTEVASVAKSTSKDPQQRVRDLPAEEKQLLKEKQDRFIKLTLDEQNRLRALDAKVSSATNPAQLSSTLSAYHAWHKTLTPEQQKELDSAPEAERIDIIRKFQSSQRRARFREFIDESVSSLPSSDYQVIYDWFDKHLQNPAIAETLEKQRMQWLDSLHPSFREWAIKNHDPKRHRQAMMAMIVFRPPPDQMQRMGRFEPLPFAYDDFQQIIPKLSEPAQLLLQSSSEPVDKGISAELVRKKLIMGMARASVVSKLPPLNEEMQSKFFGSLPENEQSRLRSMSGEAMKRELHFKFYTQQMHSRGQHDMRNGPDHRRHDRPGGPGPFPAGGPGGNEGPPQGLPPGMPRGVPAFGPGLGGPFSAENGGSAGRRGGKEGGGQRGPGRGRRPEEFDNREPEKSPPPAGETPEKEQKPVAETTEVTTK